MRDLAVCIQNSNKNTTTSETIDAINKAGFKNVFVQYYNRDVEGISEIEQIDYCKKLGLNIIFAHLGYSNKRPINEIWIEGKEGDKLLEGYIQDLNVMKEKDINMVVMHLSNGTNPPIYNEIGIERLRKLVGHASKLGIKIAFENTKNKGYLEYVLKNITDDNAGLCYDAGHCHCRFNDEFDYDFFKGRYFAIHLHDNDGSDDEHLLPFDGNINWEYVIKKLKENGYDGPITLELCYRNQYLKQTLESFYKEGYKRGLELEKIF